MLQAGYAAGMRALRIEPLPGDRVLPALVMASWAASASELRPRGRNLPLRRSRADRPLGFFWLAAPVYLVWGQGLGAAALALGHLEGPVSAEGYRRVHGS